MTSSEGLRPWNGCPEDLKREVLDNLVQSYGFWTSEEFAWLHEELGNSMLFLTSVETELAPNAPPSQCAGMEQIARWIECTNPASLLCHVLHASYILPILHTSKWSPSQCFTLSMPTPLNSLPFPIIHFSQGNYPKLPPLPMLVLFPSLSSPKDIRKADSSRTLVTSMTCYKTKWEVGKQLEHWYPQSVKENLGVTVSLRVAKHMVANRYWY